MPDTEEDQRLMDMLSRFNALDIDPAQKNLLMVALSSQAKSIKKFIEATHTVVMMVGMSGEDIEASREAMNALIQYLRDRMDDILSNLLEEIKGDGEGAISKIWSSDGKIRRHLKDLEKKRKEPGYDPVKAAEELGKVIYPESAPDRDAIIKGAAEMVKEKTGNGGIDPEFNLL